MTRAQASLFFVGLAGAVVLAACGGAAESAPAAKMPAKEPAEEREPTSVAEAQEQIARANDELSQKADKKSEADKDSAAPGPTTPGAGGSTGSTSEKPKIPAQREEPSKVGVADSCAQPCRALSSMRRAVSALCRMTGNEDARCSDARRTLQQSESRVAQCHCSP